MSDSIGFFPAVVAVWLTIGLALAVVMGRRGYNSFGWLVLGTVLGPLGVVLAIDARRHQGRLWPMPLTGGAPATSGPGPVDVLVGFDGSPGSVAAMDSVVELLGHRLGRLTVATVVPYGDIRAEERSATERLGRLAGRTTRPSPELEVLHGQPSAALRQCSIEGGYDLVAVGTRGTGIAKAILGSAAMELARDSKVPVMLVGGHQQVQDKRASGVG